MHSSRRAAGCGARITARLARARQHALVSAQHHACPQVRPGNHHASHEPAGALLVPSRVPLRVLARPARRRNLLRHAQRTRLERRRARPPPHLNSDQHHAAGGLAHLLRHHMPFSIYTLCSGFVSTLLVKNFTFYADDTLSAFTHWQIADILLTLCMGLHPRLGERVSPAFNFFFSNSLYSFSISSTRSFFS